MVTKYGQAAERIGARMTRGQILKLKVLAVEAYQPKPYAANLTSEEAARHIDALRGGNRVGGFVLNLLPRLAGTKDARKPFGPFR
jgi:hypothetical protein